MIFFIFRPKSHSFGQEKGAIPLLWTCWLRRCMNYFLLQMIPCVSSEKLAFFILNLVENVWLVLLGCFLYCLLTLSYWFDTSSPLQSMPRISASSQSHGLQNLGLFSVVVLYCTKRALYYFLSSIQKWSIWFTERETTWKSSPLGLEEDVHSLGLYVWLLQWWLKDQACV